ncbi:MAG TPA: NAD(P)H-quinone oxidoreductase [Longimicrobiales bacterium]|nr:NAD(P)H-quinone oxidoreductase [Longimicrobiales bacterium]
MRAVVITAPGGPEVLALRDVPLPPLLPGHIRVRVRATALNRADLLQRRGLYPAPAGAPADIPGLEYAGEVEAAAPDAQRWQPGERVMGIVGGGGCAEYVQVHEDEALPVPASLSLTEAAAVPEAFLTAHDALSTLMQLRAGESVLIHAAASGVGTAAIQLAHVLGARVYGTSRTARKLDAVSSLGIDYAIDTTKHDFATAVEHITNGRGVNGVLDLVGGPYLGGNIRCLAPRGRLILVGLTAGATAELDMRALLRKRLTVIGTVMRARPLDEKIAVAAAFARAALPLLESGQLRPVIDRTLPMDQVQDAHRIVESNQTIGKVVLTWQE